MSSGRKKTYSIKKKGEYIKKGYAQGPIQGSVQGRTRRTRLPVQGSVQGLSYKPQPCTYKTFSYYTTKVTKTHIR